jgi:hypothetical protein
MIAFAWKRRPAEDAPPAPQPREARIARLRRCYIGGLALSLVVGVAAIAIGYVAGSPPRLPKSLIVLERVGPAPGTWPPLDLPRQAVAATAPASQPEQKLALLPRSPDAAAAPPIDLSDLPPPADSAQ